MKNFVLVGGHMQCLWGHQVFQWIHDSGRLEAAHGGQGAPRARPYVCALSSPFASLLAAFAANIESLYLIFPLLEHLGGWEHLCPTFGVFLGDLLHEWRLNKKSLFRKHQECKLSESTCHSRKLFQRHREYNMSRNVVKPDEGSHGFTSFGSIWNYTKISEQLNAFWKL